MTTDHTPGPDAAAPPLRGAAAVAAYTPAERLAALEGLIGTLWLHTGLFVEKQLTTEQKELFADVVDTWSAGLNGGGSGEAPVRPVVTRWWREDFVPTDEERASLAAANIRL